jgi:hypothetical protein
VLELAAAPDPEGLRGAVSPALADYRILRRDVTPEQALAPPFPIIRNAFPRWLIPRTADLATQSLDEALVHEGNWHLQIHLEGKPRYYARVRRVEETWIVEWFGEAWLAAAVHRGLAAIQRRAAELDGELRLVSSSLYEFTSFWVPARDEHMVVSASPRLGANLPTRTFVPAGQLQQVLVTAFGGNYGAGGLV